MKTLTKSTMHSVLAIVIGSALLGCAEANVINSEDIAEAQEMVTSGAVFTSLRTGNWSDYATWNPAGVPSALDSANIGSAHQVTVDVPAAATNVTLVESSASKLIMNEDLTASGEVFVGKYCSLDLNDNTLQAGSMRLRQGAGVQRDPDGHLAVSGLLWTYWSAPLTLQPNDTVGSLKIQRSYAATTATSNVSNSVTLLRDGVATTLHLGAPLVLTNGISITESTLEDGGNNVTTASVYLEGMMVRQGTGTLNVAGNLTVTRNALYDARSGDVIHGNLIGTSYGTFVRGDITVNQVAGNTTGLTVDGNISLDATLDKTILTLKFDNQLAEGLDWALAWKGNHVTQLLTWVGASSGQLIVQFPAGITFDPAQHIFYDSTTGYTYVGYQYHQAECSVDVDCDDADSTTIDTCSAEGTCSHVVSPCEQITLSAPGCFWMESMSGNWCWIRPTWIEGSTEQDCFNMNSCGPGGGQSGGGCYKWDTTSY